MKEENMNEARLAAYYESDAMAAVDLAPHSDTIDRLKVAIEQWQEGLVNDIELAQWLAVFSTLAPKIVERHREIMARYEND